MSTAEWASRSLPSLFPSPNLITCHPTRTELEEGTEGIELMKAYASYLKVAREIMIEVLGEDGKFRFMRWNDLSIDDRRYFASVACDPLKVIPTYGDLG